MTDRIYSLSTIHETKLRPNERVFLGPTAMADFLADLWLRSRRPDYVLPERGMNTDEEPVTATVSAVEVSPGEFVARWVAECEHSLYRGRERGEEPCGRALTVEPGDPRFYCPPGCSFAGTVAGGRWRRVVFPEQREAVEAVLLARHPADRHTIDVDSLEDLEAENRQYGDPVPVRHRGPVAAAGDDASPLLKVDAHGVPRAWA